MKDQSKFKVLVEKQPFECEHLNNLIQEIIQKPFVFDYVAKTKHTVKGLVFVYDINEIEKTLEVHTCPILDKHVYYDLTSKMYSVQQMLYSCMLEDPFQIDNNKQYHLFKPTIQYDQKMLDINKKANSFEEIFIIKDQAEDSKIKGIFAIMYFEPSSCPLIFDNPFKGIDVELVKETMLND